MSHETHHARAGCECDSAPTVRPAPAPVFRVFADPHLIASEMRSLRLSTLQARSTGCCGHVSAAYLHTNRRIPGEASPETVAGDNDCFVSRAEWNVPSSGVGLDVGDAV